MNSQKLIIVVIMIVVAGFTAVKNCEKNPVTGRRQVILISPQQEIALGLQSAKQVEQQYGGDYRDPTVVNYVRSVGNELIRTNFPDTKYRFAFHVLDDP